MSVHHEDEGHTHHTKAYTLVWIVLLVLTAVTVYVSYFDFGEWNIFVAMIVATIKGILVCLFFMHLKYDNKMDQVVFASAFVFLAIFIGLTLSDVLERPKVVEAKVHEIQRPEGDQSAKLKDLLSKASPELIAQGRTLFQQNCVVCHGAEGRGDGAAAAALTPKPRNFTQTEGWKNGRAPAQIFKTITNGLPPSAMASFATLSVEERSALAEYVDSLGPTPPPNTPAMLAEIGVKEGPEAKTAPAQEQVELPISFAIQRLVEEANKK